MRKISEYFISILSVILFSSYNVKGQDTLFIPLRINAGIELTGPVSYAIDKDILNLEGYISADLNEKLSVAVAGGYLDYRYSQYNYSYLTNGFFLKAGADLNLLKPKKSLGKYWGGIGLKYGLSRFGWEVPEYSQTNYWGKSVSSIAPSKDWGHFLEASPGMRAEVFRNISMGWSVNIRMLLYTSTGKDLKPIYFPGFGNAEKRFSTGFSYFITWTIPYKKIRVITKPEEPEEPEDLEDLENESGEYNSGNRNNTGGNQGTMQQPRGSQFR